MLYTHWQQAWTVDVLALVYAGVYAWAAARLRGRWPRRRTLSFLAGVVCVLVALQSGIGFYDDQLLSVHMVQHMLLLLIAPLLVLEGRPVLLALRVLSPRRRGPLTSMLRRLRAFTGPVQSLALFSAVIVLTHLPALYEATLRDPALHDAEHVLYLAAGLIMWAPLLDADPLTAHRLSGLGRLVYVLATMPAMALVGAYLNRHPTLVYPAYAAPAKALGVSALTDQQQAGAIMWVAGSTVMVAIGLWAAIAALVAEERRLKAREQRALGGQAT
jgi:putative membrane protein